jgi:predicted AlkP superfamily pyrophosphatase or phosphodiesterase
MTSVESLAVSAWLAFMACLLPAQGVEAADAGRQTPSLNAPDQRDKPYLVLISIDGFRWDYPELYDTPALDRIAARGLKAKALQPLFPTLTFPSHFTIATGLPPARHGLVANAFPDEQRQDWFHYKDRATVQDGSWYLAEPIWVTAEHAGMLTAAYYFVGTEADIDGVHPTNWFAFDADVDGSTRVRQVLRWLAEEPERRPHFITLYFEDVDDYTHWHGPGSRESVQAIQRVDRQIGQLLDGLANLPHADQVYLLLVSDHGMAEYRADRQPLILDRIVDLTGVRSVEGGPYVYLYFDPEAAGRVEATRDAINANWDCGRALLPSELPDAWQVTPSARFPDLFVQADPGCAVISTPSRRDKVTPGDHGWAPEMPEMRGIFYALGPGIAPGTRTGVLTVTDVYPLMLSILELAAPESTPAGSVAPSAVLSAAFPAFFPADRTH